MCGSQLSFDIRLPIYGFLDKEIRGDNLKERKEIEKTDFNILTDFN